MIESQGLWQLPLEDLCQEASKIIVKDVMYTPSEGEYVDEGASINEGIHQLVVGHHQSLLVTKGAKVVGILRLTDVFFKISTMIKSCRP